MEGSNKRKRDDINEAASTKMPCNDPIVDPLSTEVTYDNQVFNQQQPLYVNNLPVVQNQQLLYQLEVADGSHNIIYVVLPENTSGASVLPEQQKVKSDSCLSSDVESKLESSVFLRDNVKPLCVNVAYEEKNNQLIQYTIQSNETYSNRNTLITPKVEATYVKDDSSIEDNNKLWRTHAYRCDYRLCSKSFSSVYEKKTHMETHYFQESSEYKCNLCNMVFNKAVTRNKHLESHSVPNNFKCKHCSKFFPYYTSLIRHIEQKECVTTKLCSCQYCGAKFVDTKDLSSHVDTNLKVCKCNAMICGEHAYQIHLNLCATCKNKPKTVARARTKKDAPVIVLD